MGPHFLKIIKINQLQPKEEEDDDDDDEEEEEEANGHLYMCMCVHTMKIDFSIT